MLDAGLFITEFITKARNAGLYTTTLALDMAQFFPSLHRSVIVSLLLKEGFDPSFAKLFESYYDACSTKYLWNNHYSKDYDVNNGVPQGDPLSPVISVLYMLAMLHQLFPFERIALANVCLILMISSLSRQALVLRPTLTS